MLKKLITLFKREKKTTLVPMGTRTVGQQTLSESIWMREMNIGEKWRFRNERDISSIQQ